MLKKEKGISLGIAQVYFFQLLYYVAKARDQYNSFQKINQSKNKKIYILFLKIGKLKQALEK